MIRVTEHLAHVRERLASAARVANRSADEVQLLAVSKRHPAAAIRAAAAAGQLAFGENYVDEGVEKICELADAGLEWHYIGAIQSNKTARIARYFDWVHTIDRARIAHRLASQRPAGKPPLNVCLQVNIDAEPQKAGADPDNVLALANEVAGLDTLRLRGLMCLPQPRQGLSAQREPFRQLADLLHRLRAQHPDLDVLSMGMSGDLEAAILEGATLVRVGTAIFGPRS